MSGISGMLALVPSASLATPKFPESEEEEKDDTDETEELTESQPLDDDFCEQAMRVATLPRPDLQCRKKVRSHCRLPRNAAFASTS